jgi:putative ABC transport system substrate-binding protein
VNPLNPAERSLIQTIGDDATRIGVSLMARELRRTHEFMTAFDAITEQQPDALIVGTDVLLLSHRENIIEYAASHRLPAVYGLREFGDDGGLISFGSDTVELARLAAGYVDKILKGDKPADLPVQAGSTWSLICELQRHSD